LSVKYRPSSVEDATIERLKGIVAQSSLKRKGAIGEMEPHDSSPPASSASSGGQASGQRPLPPPYSSVASVSGQSIVAQQVAPPLALINVRSAAGENRQISLFNQNPLNMGSFDAEALTFFHRNIIAGGKVNGAPFCLNALFEFERQPEYQGGLLGDFFSFAHLLGMLVEVDVLFTLSSRMMGDAGRLVSLESRLAVLQNAVNMANNANTAMVSLMGRATAHQEDFAQFLLTGSGSSDSATRTWGVQIQSSQTERSRLEQYMAESMIATRKIVAEIDQYKKFADRQIAALGQVTMALDLANNTLVNAMQRIAVGSSFAQDLTLIDIDEQNPTKALSTAFGAVQTRVQEQGLGDKLLVASDGQPTHVATPVLFGARTVIDARLEGAALTAAETDVATRADRRVEAAGHAAQQSLRSGDMALLQASANLQIGGAPASGTGGVLARVKKPKSKPRPGKKGTGAESDSSGSDTDDE